jgi:hypothetical protein
MPTERPPLVGEGVHKIEKGKDGKKCVMRNLIVCTLHHLFG